MGDNMTNLNLVKPISMAQKRIAVKCNWANYDDMPVRKSILPEGFVGKAKPELNIPTIGYPLNRNNVTVLEKILGDDKISRSRFVRTNTTALLKSGSDEKESKIIENLLTEENVDKLDYQRYLVSKHPKSYLKDKSDANYLGSQAGLNCLFNDVNLLKAAAVLDKEALDTLFKMDITQGTGKAIVDNIGKMNLEQIEKVQKDFAANENLNSLSKVLYAGFGKNNIV